MPARDRSSSTWRTWRSSACAEEGTALAAPGGGIPEGLGAGRPAVDEPGTGYLEACPDEGSGPNPGGAAGPGFSRKYGVHPQGYWATHGEPDWPAIARPAVDNTALVLAAAWLAETKPHAEELARLEPPGAFQQRQADRRMLLAAIHAGLLRRVLLLARSR
jgi:hypothetical protein